MSGRVFSTTGWEAGALAALPSGGEAEATAAPGGLAPAGDAGGEGFPAAAARGADGAGSEGRSATGGAAGFSGARVSEGLFPCTRIRRRIATAPVAATEIHIPMAARLRRDAPAWTAIARRPGPGAGGRPGRGAADGEGARGAGGLAGAAPGASGRASETSRFPP